MANRTLTTKDKMDILYLYENYEYSQDDLASIYGVGRTTIRRALEWAKNRPENFKVAEPISEVGMVGAMSTEVSGHMAEEVADKWAPMADNATGILLAMAAAGLAGFVGWIVWHAL